MPAADPAPSASQQTFQHPRAGGRKLQMQPVETLHDLQVSRRHRTWQVVIQSRLMRRTSACFVIGRSCSQSIIALRSTIAYT